MTSPRLPETPATPTRLTAPAHGAVIAIEVVAGQAVVAGQTLVLLESMKMEVPLEAPAAGTVRALLAAVGDVVAAGSALVDFCAGASPPATRPCEDRTRPRCVRICARCSSARRS